MSGGGSGGGTTVQKVELPEYARPYAIDLMQRGADLSNQGYQGYEGQRIAGLTPEHHIALGMTANRAMTGNAAMNAAQQNIEQTANGQFFGADPYANSGNAYMGQGAEQAFNPYLGSNPYLERSIDQAQEGLARNYNLHTAPQLASQQRTAGAFGNTGLQQMQNESQRNLMGEMGKVGQNIRLADYQQTQQLGQQQEQFNASQRANQFGVNANLYENMLNRGSGSFQAERDNQMRAAMFAPQLADADYKDMQALLGVGDVYGQANQDILNQQYGDWQQFQQHPYQQLDVLSNALRGAVGGGSTQTTQAPAPQYNRAANAIGGGMAGYALGDQYGYGLAGAAGGSMMGLL